MKRMIFLAAVALAVSGCGGKQEFGLNPSTELTQASEMPLPSGIGSDGQFIYALGPLDKITVEVTGLPDLRRDVTVDAQGFIAFPMAGTVEASGLTPAQLAIRLEQKLRENFVRDPRVQVNLVESTSNYITLDGQVNNPGEYPVYRDTSLMQAVARASGEGKLANVTTVMLFRQVGDAEYLGLYDLRAIRYGNYADPTVYPGDKIVVDESRTLRLLDTLQGVTNLLTTPLIVLSRQL